MQIAGTRTVEQWKKLEKQLHPGTPELWDRARAELRIAPGVAMAAVTMRNELR